MADPARRRPQNVEGPWFVDDSCIDCGTCMWMAPHVFADAEGQSAVVMQPPERDMDASAALLSCPTASIGGPARRVDFPRPVAKEVWHCGYHDRRSFGAAAYFIRGPEGNVLVDVPRFAGPLVKAIEELGGLTAILITHRDDVAGHARWADHFDVPRVIHTDDNRIDAEEPLTGSGGRTHGIDWVHVPGHTEGSVVYQHGTTLLTGDHVAGQGSGLKAFRNACWFDWHQQTESMQLLADRLVDRVLPGHGAPWHGTPAAYQQAMLEVVTWMRS